MFQRLICSLAFFQIEFSFKLLVFDPRVLLLCIRLCNEINDAGPTKIFGFTVFGPPCRPRTCVQMIV